MDLPNDVSGRFFALTFYLLHRVLDRHGAGLKLYSTDNAFFTSLLEYLSLFVSRLTFKER
jgi:hypothetical protein